MEGFDSIEAHMVAMQAQLEGIITSEETACEGHVTVTAAEAREFGSL
tara:strand:- start:839 stop:979 length:141 start_codon:yes stop_codon:yes gene_type:complete